MQLLRRIASKVSDTDKAAIKEYLVLVGIPENQIDLKDTQKLLSQWKNNYDPNKNISGITNAKRNQFIRLDGTLQNANSDQGVILASNDPDTIP